MNEEQFDLPGLGDHDHKPEQPVSKTGVDTSKPRVYTLEELSEETIPFGKYGPKVKEKGEEQPTFDAIPLDYLDWVRENMELREPLKTKIHAYLNHPTIANELDKIQQKKFRP